MKKSFLLSLVFVVLCVGYAAAQSKVNVQHNGTASFYLTVQDAVTNAQSGDTIYISGGTYDLNGELVINKTLHLIGVGHHPDSCAATGFTKLNGSIACTQGADYGSMTGFNLVGSFRFGTEQANQEVNYYTISRCKIDGGVMLSFDGSNSATAKYFAFYENISISTIQGAYARNCLFMKNLFLEQIARFNKDVMFRNNAFLYSGSYDYSYERYHVLYDVQYTVFENNIFVGDYFVGSSSPNNEFRNNLTIADFYSPSVDKNNIKGQTFESIFVNVPDRNFSYSYNYRLKSDSQGKNAGSDGTDVGIFGTSQPYKEGAIPFNPHIRAKAIGFETNGTSKLKINIQVTTGNK